jgi:hypothetical protein
MIFRNGHGSVRHARAPVLFFCISISILIVLFSLLRAESTRTCIDLGLSSKSYEKGQVPKGWNLRKRFGSTKGASAKWVYSDGIAGIKLHSKATLTFLEKRVDININDFPIVTWKWKVETVLEDIDEQVAEGDDHPIRIFFVFEPDSSKQSFWFRFKRFLYLDRVHGHPMGGRFTEYVWSSYLEPGEVIRDPGKPQQKLMVVEGGTAKLHKWLYYERNLYKDFKRLYGEEPRRLVFVGILNDTDQTGQEATSYIADLRFQRAS